MINIHKSKDDQFYFTISAKNGKVICTSETYKKKPSAFKGIVSLLRTLALEMVFNEEETQMNYKIKDHTLPKAIKSQK